MNIFFLDSDVNKCAEYHMDKHVVKMVLETAQLLCSAHVGGNVTPYKITHINHPSSIWVRSSLSNYNYLCELGIALGEEYTYRYGKEHKSVEVIKWCIKNKPSIIDDGFMIPPMVMPIEYSKIWLSCFFPDCPITFEMVISAYRRYYLSKVAMAGWKNRGVPYWFK